MKVVLMLSLVVFICAANDTNTYIDCDQTANKELFKFVVRQIDMQTQSPYRHKLTRCKNALKEGIGQYHQLEFFICETVCNKTEVDNDSNLDACQLRAGSPEILCQASVKDADKDYDRELNTFSCKNQQ